MCCRARRGDIGSCRGALPFKGGRRSGVVRGILTAWGLGTFFTFEGLHHERFYHVILPSDEHLLPLLGELGIRDCVYWTETSLGFLYDRLSYGLNGPLDLLRFKPISIPDRLRLAATALYDKWTLRAERLDEITAEHWLTRVSGRRVFDRFWRPLLEAKFGSAYRSIPALWYWARFNREKASSKKIRGYPRRSWSWKPVRSWKS